MSLPAQAQSSRCFLHLAAAMLRCGPLLLSPPAACISKAWTPLGSSRVSQRQLPRHTCAQPAVCFLQPPHSCRSGKEVCLPHC